MAIKHESAATSARTYHECEGNGCYFYEVTQPESPEGEGWQLVSALNGSNGETVWYWRREVHVPDFTYVPEMGASVRAELVEKAKEIAVAMAKQAAAQRGEEPCYCGETSTRNCPRHQNAGERKEPNCSNCGDTGFSIDSESNRRKCHCR